MWATYGWRDSSYGDILIPIIEVGLITFILLFLGEITPKVYATQNRHLIVKRIALVMYVLRTILWPLSYVLISTTKFLDSRIKDQNDTASFEDIKHAIDLTSEEESPSEEKEILKGIVIFSNTQVKAIMRARVDVVAVEFETPFSELIALINQEGYSRMPVFSDSLDQLKGILYVKDMLSLLKEGAASQDWQRLIRPAYFVPETKKIDDLLEEFKRRRLHIAVVVDVFGGTAGNVTLGDADTLAGLILEVHGKLPLRGDVVEQDNFRFTIESASQRRIKRVKFEVCEIKHEEKT